MVKHPGNKDIEKSLCSPLETPFANASTKFWWSMTDSFEEISGIVRPVGQQECAPYSINHWTSASFVRQWSNECLDKLKPSRREYHYLDQQQ